MTATTSADFLAAAGVRPGTIYFGGMPQEMALENIRRVAAEVMPAFRQAPAPAQPTGTAAAR